MYKILHIPTNTLLNLPDSSNKEEAVKLIKLFCKLHKQYMTARPYVKQRMTYANVLSKFTNSLYEDEFEAFFVSQGKKKYQIQYIESLNFYYEYFDSEPEAVEALRNALKKQYKTQSSLRKWCLGCFAVNPITGSFFDNFKTDWLHKQNQFKIVEV